MSVSWIARSACLLACLMCGCGSTVYEARLAQTVKYFDYTNRLNANLAAAPFVDQGLTVRVPQQFALVPRVVNPENKEFDNRQPDFLRAELPGLLAVWKAEVQTDVGTGKYEARPCYLYALSNAERWRNRQAGGQKASADPLTFRMDALQTLSDALSLPIDPNQGVTIQVPGPGESEFCTEKTFKSVTLRAPEPIHGVDTEFRLFIPVSGSSDAQGFLVAVVPAGVSPAEKLHERLPLMLHTLVLEKPPAQAAPIPSAPARPGSGGPSPNF